MIASILAILAALLPWLLDRLEQTPARQERKRSDATDQNIQQARAALAAADGALFDAHAAAQHDRVQQALRDHRRGGDGDG